MGTRTGRDLGKEDWGLGNAQRSTNSISYIGDLDVLATFVVAAQLKHQCPHMAAQLSL